MLDNFWEEQKIKLMNSIRKYVSKRPPWPLEHRNKLIELIAAGYRARRIVEEKLLPYNQNAIQKQMSRMKLTNQLRGQKISVGLKNKLSDATISSLEEFLIRHYQTCPPTQLEIMWSNRNDTRVSAKKIRYYLRKLRIKLPRKQIWSMPFSRQMRKKNQAARIQRLRGLQTTHSG